MSEELTCRECGHSIREHVPDFETYKIAQCQKCKCDGFYYSGH